MTDAIYCPLGNVDGCEVRDGSGTCEAVRNGNVKDGTARVCAGYGAVLCAKAFERWEADGRRDAGASRPLNHSPRPTPPERDPQNRWMDPAIATVPGNFGAWEIYADDEADRARQREVRDHVERMIERYGVAWDSPNLVFQGAPGTGKTLLARIAGRVASDAGRRVRFVVFRDLLLGVKATRDSSSQAAEDAILQPFKDADLLVLDDVRPVFDSQDDENIADDLFKARYGEDRGTKRRPTIVTTNLSRGELNDVIGEAAMRRLLCDGEVNRQIFAWKPWRTEAVESVPTGHWSEGPFCLFDVETTDADPKTARIVQASFIVQNPDGSAGRGSYTALVNPGAPISEEATAVHGITQAQVEKDGVAPIDALGELTKRFQRAAERGYPVVIYNVPFDWPVYERECQRHNIGGPISRPRFIDPLLIDRKVDKYRKGSRTLAAAVKHYLGHEFKAHNAEADALEMGLLVREMVRRYPVLQRPTLDELQDLQRKWWATWRAGFNEFQQGPKGKGYVNEEEWPV
jgi:DNA polymerase-3 subunit epsilon